MGYLKIYFKIYLKLYRPYIEGPGATSSRITEEYREIGNYDDYID